MWGGITIYGDDSIESDIYGGGVHIKIIVGKVAKFISVTTSSRLSPRDRHRKDNPEPVNKNEKSRRSSLAAIC